jgi:rubredoxin
VDRKCSNCGHEWTADLKVTAEGEVESRIPDDPSAFAKAKKQALANLDMKAKKKKKDIDEQVLCPECSHFSTEAMDKHFRKGYTAGLLSKYKTEEWRDLFSSLGFAVLSLAAVGGAILATNKLIKEGEWRWLYGVFFPGVVSIYSARSFVKHLRKFVHSTKEHSKVARMVRSCSGDELLQLAIRCYHQNNNSLEHGDAWVQVLSGEGSK